MYIEERPSDLLCMCSDPFKIFCVFIQSGIFIVKEFTVVDKIVYLCRRLNYKLQDFCEELFCKGTVEVSETNLYYNIIGFQLRYVPVVFQITLF